MHVKDELLPWMALTYSDRNGDMKNIFLIFCSLAYLAGCSTFESSTYENRSTEDENVVTATGKAAEVAAGANTSHNCPSCSTEPSGAGASTGSQAPQSKVEESTARVVDSATDTLTSEISNEVNQSIRKIFD